LEERTACSSATLTHLLNFPNSELLAAAQRLRTHIPTKHLTKIDNICHN
jgi:hypothetical protein